MTTFRFELGHKPTRNKTYNLYLMVTAAGKRTKKKAGIQLKRIDDFNPQCKGNNWIRADVPDTNLSQCTSAATLLLISHKKFGQNHQPSRIFSVIATLPQPSGIWVASTHPKPMKRFSMSQPFTTVTEESAGATKEAQAIELLKGMTAEQIMAVISAINK